MEKAQVFLMFYPMDWQRHTFDGMSTSEIISFVKEHGIEDVRFVEWGYLIDSDWSEIYYDADLFNDYDDMADDYVIKDCKKLCKGKKLRKDFIMNHWCYPVTKNTMDAITNIAPVVKHIRKKGVKGAEACEKYIDLEKSVRINTHWKAEQICHFNDVDEVQVYALDEEYNGMFFPWYDLKYNTQCAIRKQLKIK